MKTNSIPAKLKKISLGATEVACGNCGLLGLCEVAGLGSDEALLDRIVSRRERIGKGQRLFSPGERFQHIFAVKSGSFRSYAARDDGTEQVVGFHFPGELIGLEAIDSGRYTYAAEALEGSSVCRMSLADLNLLGEKRPTFQEELIRSMSRRILHDQWMSMLMGTHSAEQRLAAFLVSVATRLDEHGLPSKEFRLPMSRNEIANYLGLAVETVSRTFKQFEARGLLVVSGRFTRLFKLDVLSELASVRPLWQLQVAVR